jgi:3-hydroxy-9,10-secoandrosta-1,3,5(10)-triene-9,17-dione monooxygenase
MNGFDALANARNVTAVLSDQSDYGEHATRLPDESVKALKASGMLSLWRPAGLGGHECDPVTAAMATEEIAMADSAAGWMMHGVSAMWFDLRLASPELIEEVVASADVPVFAESYNKPQRAVAADGGFLINGATPFASNCQVADWIGHLAVSDESTLVVYHPRDVLTIDDDWNSLGMRGTSSNTVVSKDVFVPAHRVVDFGDPSPNADFEGALYRLPLGIVPVAVAAVAGKQDAVRRERHAETPNAGAAAFR